MRFLVILGLLVVLASAGCETVSSRPRIDGVVYGYQAYDDLPVPPDFTFDDSDRSWAFRLYENSPLNLRSCVLRYEGDRDVGLLVNWYASQMPEHKWQYTSSNRDADGRRATVVYTKESEQATIEIVRELGFKRPEPYTVITLELGPVR